MLLMDMVIMHGEEVLGRISRSFVLAMLISTHLGLNGEAEFWNREVQLSDYVLNGRNIEG